MSRSSPDYHALAEFRHQIRRFLHSSEVMARAHALEPQQHQLLLMIKGMPADARPTIRQLAARMLLTHHSVVELVSRLAKIGAVVRTQGDTDRREVLVRLTPAGESLLRKLSASHQEELKKMAPQLIRSLRAVLKNSPPEPAV